MLMTMKNIFRWATCSSIVIWTHNRVVHLQLYEAHFIQHHVHHSLKRKWRFHQCKQQDLEMIGVRRSGKDCTCVLQNSLSRIRQYPKHRSTVIRTRYLKIYQNLPPFLGSQQFSLYPLLHKSTIYVQTTFSVCFRLCYNRKQPHGDSWYNYFCFK